MSALQAERLTITVGANHSVSGLFERPSAARAVLGLAHGAGAGMEHPSMQGVATALTRRGIAILRYQFPYMERKSRCAMRPFAPLSRQPRGSRRICRSSPAAARSAAA